MGKYSDRNRTMIFLLSIFSACSVLAASPTIQQPDSVTFNSILVSADYASDNIVYGNLNTTVSQPCFSSVFSYTSRSGMEATAGYSLIDNSDTSLNKATHQYDFTLGYRFSFPLDLYLSGSYTRFFYSKNTTTLRSTFDHQMELDAGYSGKFADVSASAFYLIGNTGEFFLSLQNSYNFSIDNFPFRNVSTGFMPGVFTILSSQQFYNEYLLNQFLQHPVYYMYRWRLMGYTKEQIKAMLLEEKKFTFTSFMATVPVCFSWKNFMLTGGATFLKPLNQPSFTDDNWVVMYNFNLSYMLLW